jgi:hypothetical protein
MDVIGSNRPMPSAMPSSGQQQKGGEFTTREGSALREVRRHDWHLY